VAVVWRGEPHGLLQFDHCSVVFVFSLDAAKLLFVASLSVGTDRMGIISTTKNEVLGNKCTVMIEVLSLVSQTNIEPGPEMVAY